MAWLNIVHTELCTRMVRNGTSIRKIDAMADLIMLSHVYVGQKKLGILGSHRFRAMITFCR